MEQYLCTISLEYQPSQTGSTFPSENNSQDRQTKDAQQGDKALH